MIMPAKIKCRTRYTSVDESPIGVKFLKSSLTQQHFREECDINLIASRYLCTGVLPDNDRPVFYGDVSQIPVDLMQAYDAIETAENNFMRLPSDVRKSIDNDPARLLEWISKNHDQAVKYGLVVQRDTNVSEKEVKKDAVIPDTKATE